MQLGFFTACLPGLGDRSFVASHIDVAGFDDAAEVVKPPYSPELVGLEIAHRTLAPLIVR